MINKIKIGALGVLIICCVANGAPNTPKSEMPNETAEREKKENRLGTKLAYGTGAFTLSIIGRDLKNRSRDYSPDPDDCADNSSGESNGSEEPDSAATLDWPQSTANTEKDPSKSKLTADKNENPQNRFRFKNRLYTGGYYACWAGTLYMTLEMLNAQPGALFTELTSIISLP